MRRTRNPVLIAVGLITAILPSIGLFTSLNLLFPVPLVIGVACVIAGSLKSDVKTQGSATAIWIVICLGSAIGPFVIRAWADRSGKPIKIVLPDGYQGQFSIIKDSKGGRELDLSDGAWTFRIPESGVLKVKKTFPFHMWHRETYVYEDGKSAPVTSLGVTAGIIQTGPNRSEGSTNHDGTLYRFEVVGGSDLSQR